MIGRERAYREVCRVYEIWMVANVRSVACCFTASLVTRSKVGQTRCLLIPYWNTAREAWEARSRYLQRGPFHLEGNTTSLFPRLIFFSFTKRRTRRELHREECGEQKRSRERKSHAGSGDQRERFCSRDRARKSRKSRNFPCVVHNRTTTVV